MALCQCKDKTYLYYRLHVLLKYSLISEGAFSQLEKLGEKFSWHFTYRTVQFNRIRTELVDMMFKICNGCYSIPQRYSTAD